jgi:hypothetical protein
MTDHYPASYHEDDAVTVLYAPDSPQGTAMIDRGFWNWMPPVGLCLFGMILAAVGPHLRRRTTALSGSATTLIDGR